MTSRLQLRRGTTTEMDAFTGAIGEPTYDVDKSTIVVHDGVTEGGIPLARGDLQGLTLTTDNVTEGTSNLYWIEAPVDNEQYVRRNGDWVVGDFSSYSSADFTTDFNTKTTDNLSQGSINLYYADSLVDNYLSGGTGIDYSNGTISHQDTSTQNSVSASADTFVSGVQLDAFGHVTGLVTDTVSASSGTANDSLISISAGTGLDGGGTFTTNQSSDGTITVSHADTSTQASVSNFGGSVIQGVNLDSFGHITGVSSVDLDLRYLQSYDETDTLDSVTDRGSSTTNSITVSGFTANGNIQINGAADLNSNLNAAGGVLFVDSVTDRVGILNTNPGTALTVGNTSSSGLMAVFGTGIFYPDSSGFVGGSNNNIGFAWQSPNLVGTVDNATSITIGTASDYRLKANEDLLENGLDIISALRPITFDPVEFDGTVSSDRRATGLIAHEVQAIRPSVVSGDKDAVNDEGNPMYQSVNYAGLVPDLIKSIQEQQEIIESLMSRIETLESK